MSDNEADFDLQAGGHGLSMEEALKTYGPAVLTHSLAVRDLLKLLCAAVADTNAKESFSRRSHLQAVYRVASAYLEGRPVSAEALEEWTDLQEWGEKYKPDKREAS